MLKDNSRILIAAVIITGTLASSACSHINVKQMAYETLRQEDCRINELEDFCSRNFASEYREYERLRQDYLRSQDQSDWRMSQVDTKIKAN